jgi:hypothetical protein
MSLDAIRLKDGTLPAYAWPGGYPVFYLDGENCVLCPKCANKEATAPTVYGVNWEDPQLFCEECNECIESAYAEDESEEA